MITVNSLSGGKTSSYMAYHYPADYNVFSIVCVDDKKLRIKDKKLIQMVNDKLFDSGFGQKYGEFIGTVEDDKILNVMFDLEQMIGKNIFWVRHNSFEKEIKKKKMLPNLTMRYCTTELKIIPICEFVINNKIDPVFMNQGIRYDEHERQKKGKDREYRNKIIIGKSENGRNKWKEYFWAVANYPLIINKVTNPKIQDFWKGKNIDFPKDSNCIGCFWKDVQQLRKNWDDHPKKMQWFSDQEIENNHFFKPGINYRTIKKIGLQAEFNFGTGSGCQAGFCTD